MTPSGQREAASFADRLRDAFGASDLPYSLFHEMQFVLRFDLGGDLPMGPLRVLRALDRARDVADLAFARTNELHVS